MPTGLKRSSGRFESRLAWNRRYALRRLYNEAMAPIGLCALCLRDSQVLQKSHFLPAGVYRIIRDETQDNPDPLKLNDNGVFQDSRQVWDYFLCQECEQRLNKNGEEWFLRHCWRKTEFLLGSLVDESTPVAAYPRLKVYHAAQIPKISAQDLAYFGVSMFWRASAHRWRTAGKTGTGIALGAYEEQFREYLAGKAPFPESTALWVSVPQDTKTPFVHLSLTPYGGRWDRCHLYKLVVLGVGFYLLVGARIPSEARSMCFVSGNGNPIYRTDMLEEGILRDIHLKFRLHPHLLDGPKGRASRSRREAD